MLSRDAMETISLADDDRWHRCRRAKRKILFVVRRGREGGWVRLRPWFIINTGKQKTADARRASVVAALPRSGEKVKASDPPRLLPSFVPSFLRSCFAHRLREPCLCVRADHYRFPLRSSGTREERKRGLIYGRETVTRYTPGDEGSLPRVADRRVFPSSARTHFKSVSIREPWLFCRQRIQPRG